MRWGLLSPFHKIFFALGDYNESLFAIGARRRARFASHGFEAKLRSDIDLIGRGRVRPDNAVSRSNQRARAPQGPRAQQ